MSNLLNEAIVDAKALRAAALKNAETVVIEKYSEDVRKTLEKLLEQEEAELGAAAPELGADPGAAMEDPMAAPAPDMGMEAAPVDAMGAEPVNLEEIAEDDIPFGSTDGFADLDGKNLSSFPAAGENVELTLDLGALQEGINALKEELANEEQIDINEIDLASLLGEDDSETPDPEADVDYTAGVDDEKGDPAGGEAADETADSIAMKNAGLEEDAALGLASHLMGKRDNDDDEDEEEEDNINELVDAIVEKLTVDMGADLSGWAGRSSEDQKWAMEKELAHRRSTDVEEELKNLKKAQEELVFENNQINEQNDQYKQAVNELKENLQDVNLSNARLLYTNRILRNTSLNERQKDKIVEAISGAGSVMEARTIYDTLQCTVQTTLKKGPQSLSEAIGRRSTTVMRASRKEVPNSDPFQDRMKKLAGIK
jgi:hypothetical protein